ncbi:MAG TPA: hypothetical protein VET27_20595 [Mycobacterium sp.]|nr:hypothetical protein [Mycobacterium sp.]
MIPAESPQQPDPGPTTPPTANDPGQRPADEKELRQSTDESIQILAMQFQATRCNDEDELAGNDDPALPLVTCSEDGAAVYLLDKSIASGEHVRHASAVEGDQNRGYAVDVEFDSDGAAELARITKIYAGDQIAYTLDTRVIGTSVIREPIADGRLTIAGDFTAESAGDLAAALQAGRLPLALTFESSTGATLAGTPGSSPLRIGLVAGGGVLALAVVGAIVASASSHRRQGTS